MTSRRGLWWTTADNMLLRQLAAAGANRREAARKLQRSAHAIRVREAMLGISLTEICRPWSITEDAAVSVMAQAGFNQRDIGERLRRKANAVKQRAIKLGVRIRSLPSLVWSMDEDQRLIQFATANHTCREAAQALRRSIRGTRARAKALGLRFTNHQRASNWHPRQDRRLRYLVQAGRTRKKMAEIMGCCPETITRRVKILGLAIKPIRLGPWSSERITLACSMWLGGKAGSTIAKALGPEFTRAAVIAKMHRLKCTRPALPPKIAKRRQTEAAVKATKAAAAARNPGRHIPTPKPPTLLKPKPVVDVARICHDDLASTHCRWPVGEACAAVAKHAPLYCGKERVNGLPYCMGHCVRAFREVPAFPKQTYPKPGVL